MYFLSGVDQKKLVDKILTSSRSVGVSEELRGWNWNKPPLKPMYEDRIPMYSVCSKYCPTSRDVFLDRVMRAPSKPGENVILGVALHRAVSTTITSFQDGTKPTFDAWYAAALRVHHVPVRQPRLAPEPERRHGVCLPQVRLVELLRGSRVHMPYSVQEDAPRHMSGEQGKLDLLLPVHLELKLEGQIYQPCLNR